MVNTDWDAHAHRKMNMKRMGQNDRLQQTLTNRQIKTGPTYNSLLPIHRLLFEGTTWLSRFEAQLRPYTRSRRPRVIPKSANEGMYSWHVIPSSVFEPKNQLKPYPSQQPHSPSSASSNTNPQTPSVCQRRKDRLKPLHGASTGPKCMSYVISSYFCTLYQPWVSSCSVAVQGSSRHPLGTELNPSVQLAHLSFSFSTSSISRRLKKDSTT